MHQRLCALSFSPCLLLAAACGPTYRYVPTGINAAGDAAPSSATVATPTLVLQSGHGGRITTLSFNRDGTRLATAAMDSSIRVWDVATGGVIASMTGRAALQSVVWVDDDRMIVSSSDDNTIVFWDAATGAQTGELEFPPEAFSRHDLTASSDGRLLAIATWDEVTVWDVAAHRALATTELYNARPVAWQPGADRLLITTEEGVALWEPRANTRTLLLPGVDPLVLAWSADGGSAFVMDSELQRVDARTGQVLWSVTPRIGTSINALACSLDGRLLTASADNSGPVVLDAATGQEVFALAPHYSNVFAWSPQGELAVGDAEVAAIWAVPDPREVRRLGGETGRLMLTAWSPDGRTLITADHDKAVRLWAAETGEVITTVAAPADGLTAVAWSPDNATVALAGESVVEIWDAKLDKRQQQFTLAASVAPNAVVWSRDGRDVVVADSDGAIWALPRQGGAPRRLLSSTERQQVRGLSFVDSGRVLLVAYADAQTAPAVTLASGAPWPLPAAWGEGLSALASSPDGRLVAGVKLHSDAIEVRDAVSGARVAGLPKVDAHSILVSSLVWSPDSTLLAATEFNGDSQVLTIWDARSGARRLQLPMRNVSDVQPSFSPDARFVTFADAGMAVITRLHDGARVYLRTFEANGRAAPLAFTDDGHFAGADAAATRVTFRLGAELVTADQLFERFHRPHLLADFLGAKPLAPAGEDAATPAVGPAPKVELVGVPSSVDDDHLRVRVRAFDRGGGVAEVRVFVNGARADDGGRGLQAVRAALDEEIEVVLSPGINEVAAEAYNERGRIRSARVTATVTCTAATTRPTLYVLAVSLNDYEDPAMRLGYSNADATAVTKLLLGQQGRLYDEVKVLQLTDAKATREAVEGAVKELARGMRPQDVFIFYAAGHGVMLACEEEAAPRYRLLTYRSTLRKEKTVCAEAVSETDLAGLLRLVPAQKKLVLLDTCEAGGATTGELMMAMRGAEEIDAIKRLARAEGVAILTAAKAAEYAGEVPELGHGIFSYALLEGLGGKAAEPGKPVTVHGLVGYVEDAVESLSRKYFHRPQYPIVSTQGQNFPVALPR